MLTIPPPEYRKRHHRRPRAAKSGPPGPVLIAAVYLHTVPAVLVTFDQVVSLAGLVAGQIVVQDPVNLNKRMVADGSSILIGPNQYAISLVDGGAATGTAVTLTASAGNGIVAVDGGAAWAGVTAVGLPFP